MNRDTLDKLQSSADVVRSASYELASLSRSFEEVGNVIVSKKLARMADDLGAAADRVDDASGEAIHTAFEASQQATQNMLLTALAVAGEGRS